MEPSMEQHLTDDTGNKSENIVKTNFKVKKEVDVTFVSDHDVTDFIFKLGSKANRVHLETGRRMSSRRNGKESEGFNIISEIAELENQELPPQFAYSHKRPSAPLGDDGSDYDTIGFQTPRRSMIIKAQISASKYSTPTIAESQSSSLQTPTGSKLRKRNTDSKAPLQNHNGAAASTPTHRNTLMSSVITPKSLRNRKVIENSSLENIDTPSGSRYELRRHQTPKKEVDLTALKTPCVERREIKSRLQELNQDSQAGSDDESYCSEEDLSDDSSDQDAGSSSSSKMTVKQLPSAGPLPLKASIKSNNDCDFKSEAYFLTQSSKSITSDNTLSRLRTPRLRHEAISDLLSDVHSAHQAVISKLSDDYLQHGQQWLFSLWQGYSVVLHGLGSKRHILTSFHQEFLSDFNVLVVNGFFPNITIKEILESILIQMFGRKNISTDPLENVNLIESIQSKRDADPLYLLVHNLDGPSLRGDRAQTVLSRLAQVRNVFLIASIDHINTGLMWDQSKLRRYNFVWWDVTSFAPYTEETSFESSLLLHQSSTLTLASLKSVFKSLTQNAKKLFKLLAENQLERGKHQNFTGIPFSEFYWKCREAFIASNDGALRAQLTEFVDHHLVKYRRGVDGVEALIIPIESTILSEFIESYEEEQ